MLSLTTWLCSTTIARSDIFDPARAAIKKRSKFVYDCVSCQYCISHWVGLFWVLIYRPRLLDSGLLAVDLAFSTFAVIAASALIARTIGRM